MRCRDTVVQVDLQAVRQNLLTLRNAVGEQCGVMAVVKANAYGHGAVPVSETLLKSGAKALGVATAEEGAELRAHGIQASILILGASNERETLLAAQNGLTVTVFDRESVRRCGEAAKKTGTLLHVHAKIDTGMGRIGVRGAKELQALLCAVNEYPQVRLTGVFTHFAAADEEDLAYSRMQLKRFEALFPLLPDGLTRHAAASAALLRMPESRLNFVRAGLLLYGCPPFSGCELPLSPAMTWKTAVTFVKTLPAGESVSYGHTFTAEQPTKIATLAIGYADGYPRALSGKASVLIGGKRCPLVGRICMDQAMADVTKVPGVSPGEEAVLLGAQGNERISADELAQLAGTVSYEILTAHSERVPIEMINANEG